MNEALIGSIEGSLETKSTDELLAIWQAANREEYSDEGFEAVRRILGSRGHAFPPKTTSLEVEKVEREDIAKQMEGLPAIPVKKARSIERNFAVWSSLLTLWLFFGFFNVLHNFSAWNDYSKAIDNLRKASSPSFSAKPEFAEQVKRASQHIDALATLQHYFALGALAGAVVWGCLFPIRKRFRNRQEEGPKYLLRTLLVMLGVHTLGALLTIPIPMMDAVGFLDILQIRVLPVVIGIIALTLIPFFGKWADVFYQYVAIDRKCFKKNGIGTELMRKKSSI